ncbi:sensor histidine kinase [Adhaeribacter radiodurans]|uniref:Histidine kinase n=1 Tax=Adhaeribacter radiodurans TaxID=2745197 RepID=A0A7L7L383_9BACT|nr:histidine kinase [Adhaeribacter radiodurans]QMU27261.1 histidine kinase [Adhaeribacter radiodurans]
MNISSLFCNKPTLRPNPLKLIHSYRVRLIGILVMALLRFSLFGTVTISTEGKLSLAGVLDNILLASLLIWETSRAVVLYTHRRYALQLSIKRFSLEVLGVFIANGVFYSAQLIMHEGLQALKKTNPLFILYGLFYTFLYGVLVAAFYELLFYMEAWKKATQEAEELKKINLLVQLESLKNQVKPHFLFNSLNTLTALVEKDKAQAVKFIAELAQVYRYLLQSNEKELIALVQELQFTQAYFFLLRTRFGEGISLRVEVEEDLHSCLIPPLTLQILLENAMKHNQISARKPLIITIHGEAGEWLVIQNNLQPKRGIIASNGMGLANIAAKYKILNQPEVIILKEVDFFTVKVPLIKAEAA